MQFKTTLTKVPQSFNLDYQQQILMIGSCFAANIGALLQENYFRVKVNPYGIIYNPLSLANSLHEIVAQKQYTNNDLFFYNELYASFNHHGKFKHTSNNILLDIINKNIIEHNEYLKNTDILFCTFGTAFVYEHQEKQQIVANCHKLPSQTFNKRLLSSNEIVAIYVTLIMQLKDINPNIKIVFTVSPVRHIKDGLINNNRSKAVLLTAVHELVEQLDCCYYFPAYELLIDDLRDYRFYDNDLVHPNEMAVQYIWNYLIENHLTDKAIFELVVKYNKLKAHNILFPETISANKHMLQLDVLRTELLTKYPNLLIVD